MNGFAKLMHNNPIHSEVHESKFHVLVAEVLRSRPLQISIGIVPIPRWDWFAVLSVPFWVRPLSQIILPLFESYQIFLNTFHTP